MSFFDQSNVRKGPEADPRVSASGWGKKQLGVFGDASYNQKAWKAHQNSTSIVGGKIVKPIHAEPRSKLPSNVHGFDNSTTASESSWTGASTNDTDRQRDPPVGSRNLPVGPTNFAKNAPIGGRTQSVSYAALAAAQVNTADRDENALPPHLRRGSSTRRSMASTPSTVPTPSTTSTQKMYKPGNRGTPAMNSRTAAKSAKHASNYPCTYQDCTQGFEHRKELKFHKIEKHDYCRICDLDCVDYDDLLYHKINSDKHICCRVCGDDFRSESGRNFHEKQMHSTPQKCTCVGCGFVFDSGSALIDHIYENKCRDRKNELPKLVNEDMFRKMRAESALFLDYMSHRPSNTSKLIADMQPPDSDLESVGGVSIQRSILDRNDPIDDDDDALIDLSDAGISDAGTVTPTKTRKEIDFPTLADAAKVKGKSKEQNIVNGMGSLNIRSTKGGTGATMIDFREAQVGGKMQIIKTDWDGIDFQLDPVDGHYHCPFSKCPVSVMYIDDLKAHLTSGIHQGTDHRCLKCLKHFKTPAALIAHMESNSVRCHIKETDHFATMLSVTSGGFLTVAGRHADGTVKISASTMEELEERKVERAQMMAWEDPDYDWSL